MDISTEAILLIIMWAGFLISLCTGAFMTCLAFQRLDEIEGHLTRSACVRNIRNNWGNEWMGRTFRILSISSAFEWHNLFIRKNELDPEDYKAFPKSLERLLIWPGRLLMGSSAVWLVVGTYFAYSGK